MANPEHVEILKQGAKNWNEWRKQNPFVAVDLRGANLKEKDLSFRNIDSADFTGADLTGCILIHSNFYFSSMDGIILNEASLQSTKFILASLSGANIVNADFNSCLFQKVLFSGANLSNSGFSEGVFIETDLSNVIGLDTVRHFGPTSVSIDTIFKSKGQIPVPFLRGCGVPEDFIKLIPSLTAQPFEFYKCFISHSSDDMDFCKRLHADLQNEGVRVWFFPEDARTGRGVWDEIDKSIKIYDKLMVVCSENSLQSGPVLREIERALQREDREHKHILFPIRIDDYIFDEWEHPRKADVIAKVVGDFSNWKDHDSYQKAFDRLMRDLKASEEEA